MLFTCLDQIPDPVIRVTPLDDVTSPDVIQQRVAMSWLHEFHETCHFVTFHFMKKDLKRCCDTTTPKSIHTKDESKRGSAFAFIFGVN